MSDTTQSVEHAEQQVHKAVSKAHGWIEPAARVGYVAKGLVFALIGVLALLTAANINLGQKGGETNQNGVINFISRQPLGTVILLAIAAGLIGYSVWRLISAILNAEDKGPMKRIGYAISGLAYGYLAFVAIKAVLGERAQTDDKSAARTLIDFPMGQTLLVVAGCLIACVAIGQIANAISAKFKEVFKLREMPREQAVAAIWLGRIGLTARAVLFGLIGWFLIRAGMDGNPAESGGLNRALAALQGSVFGNIGLVAVSIGLICYGAFMMFEARYRKIKTADPEKVEAANTGTPEALRPTPQH